MRGRGPIAIAALILACHDFSELETQYPCQKNPALCGAAGAYRISGAVSGAGVTSVLVTLSGDAAATVTTDANGDYVLAGLWPGSYTVTPSKPGFAFTPSSYTLVVAAANVLSKNFTAQPAYTLAGTVTGPGSVAGIGMALLDAFGGVTLATTSTDATGHYAFSGLVGNEYRVRPSASASLISPSTRTLFVFGPDVADADFAIYPLQDYSGTTSNALRGVWGASANDVWAVGEQGTVLHWDGGSWSSIPSGTADALYAAWGSASNDVWAVGTWANGDGGTLLHWDGMAWSAALAGPSIGTLRSVFGTSASDVWAVGENESMAHWDGGTWAVAPASFGFPQMYAVWGTTSDDYWAGGTFFQTKRMDGGSWWWVNGQSGERTTGIWGAARDDVWTIGVSADSGVASHWTGASWGNFPVEYYAPNKPLNAISGSSVTEVWAVGAHGTIVQLRGADGGFVLLDDVGGANPANALNGVWTSPTSSAVWAVGENGTVIRWQR